MFEAERLGPTQALIGLGSNLAFQGLSGTALLEAALRELEERGLGVVDASSAWASDAWPSPSDPAFVNAVALLDIGDRDPAATYKVLAEVEIAFGRVRAERWGPRSMDLDLIDQGGLVTETGGIMIPHRRAHERCFVLAPLAELAPIWRHPSLNRSAADLLAEASVGEEVQRIGPLRIARSADAD